MLTAVADSFWRHSYTLWDSRGLAVGRLGLDWMGEGGTIELARAAIQISRDGWTGPWRAVSGGGMVAMLIKPSAFSHRFDMHVADCRYRLEPHSWSYSFDVFQDLQQATAAVAQGACVAVGFVEAHFLNSRISVNMADDQPLLAQALAAWVVILMRRRRQQAAS